MKRVRTFLMGLLLVAAGSLAFSGIASAASETLTVTGAGDGAATIISQPAGIECVWDGSATSGTCTAQFDTDTVAKVNLVAVMEIGSTFGSWQPCPAGANALGAKCNNVPTTGGPVTVTANIDEATKGPHGEYNIGPNGERTESSASFTPLATTGPYSKLYRDGTVASQALIHADVTVPGGVTGQDIFPLKRVKLQLPTDVSFNPSSATKVCTDAMMNEHTNLSMPPNQVIDICPNSVIGNGTAELFLSHNFNTNGPTLPDAVMVVFNAGRENGLAKIKIYGFSKGTGVGVYMEAVLEQDGTLNVRIPQMALDSAVANFTIDIPGTQPIVYNFEPVPRSVGQDKNYLQAKCSTGDWTLNSLYELGTRDTNGVPTSFDYPVEAPQFNDTCVGEAGAPPNQAQKKGKIGAVKVAGPAKAKRNKQRVYKVRVKNAGNGVAKKVIVKVNGPKIKGKKKINLGNIQPKKVKVAKFKLKFGKLGKNVVKVNVTSNGAGKKNAKKVVRVKK